MTMAMPVTMIPRCSCMLRCKQNTLPCLCYPRKFLKSHDLILVSGSNNTVSVMVEATQTADRL